MNVTHETTSSTPDPFACDGTDLFAPTVTLLEGLTTQEVAEAIRQIEINGSAA